MKNLKKVIGSFIGAAGAIVSLGALLVSCGESGGNGDEPVAEYGPRSSVKTCCADALNYEKCVERYQKSGYCESGCCGTSADKEKCKQKFEDDNICEDLEHSLD